MPRSISELVADNFSKDPEYYDRAAEAQKEVAETLAETIRSAASAAPAPPDKILEIGCGTGFLTKKLVETFPSAEIAATDISPAMLAFCERAVGKRKALKNARIDFILDDISKTRLRGTFDLVASSFAFQWAGRLAEIAPTLSRLSRPGGLLSFSILMEGTFSDVRALFEKNDVRFPIPHLASERELRDTLHLFENAKVERKILREKHPSLLEFLRHLKKVGAVNASGEMVPTAGLRRVLAKNDGQPVLAEYDVAIVNAERKP